MGVAAKQSLISTTFNYLGVAIGAFNTLWLIPKAMSTGEIGLYRVIISMAVLCVPFAQMGMVQSSMKFFPQYKSRGDENRFLTVLLLLSFLSYFIFLALAWVFQDPISSFFEVRSPEVKNHYDLVLSLVFFMIIFSLFESFSRNHLQIIVPNFLKEVFLRFMASVLVLLFLTGVIDFIQLMQGVVLNYFIAVTILAIYLWIKYQVRPALPVKGIQASSIVQYALFTLLGTGGAAIVMQIDSILVTGLLGLDQNGIYATAFFIAVVVEIPRRAIGQIATPLISRSFHEDKKDDVAGIYRKSSINLLIAGSLIYILIVINLDELFYFIPDWQRFEAGKIVVIFVGMAKLIDISFGVNTEVIIMSRYYRFNILALIILSVLTILTNLWLIPIYGLKGAAMATAISLIIFNLVKYLYVWAKLKIQPFNSKTTIVLAIAILTYSILYFTPSTGNFIIDIAYRSALILIIFVPLNYLMKTSDEFLGLVKKVRLSMFKK